MQKIKNNLLVEKAFLNMTQILETVKEEIDKLYYMKVENVFKDPNTINIVTHMCSYIHSLQCCL